MELDSILWLSEGLLITIVICLISIGLGILIGLIIALIRYRKIPILTQLFNFYISFVRAIPLVTLTLFVFLAAHHFGLDFNREMAAIFALTINTAAFNAEVWKTAFITFSPAQKEAAFAYGMTPLLYFRRILLPQALVSSLPGLVNEMSFLIKSSPAIAIIGVADLTRISYQIGNETYEPLPPILVALAMYMVFIGTILKLQQIAEKNARRLAL